MSTRTDGRTPAPMPIEAGNLSDLDTQGSGWFIGFSDWTRWQGLGAPDSVASGGGCSAQPHLRFMPSDALARGIQMKWMVHPAGDPRGAAKPSSVGRTISIFVSESGRFVLEFAPTASFDPHQVCRHTLQRHGDYVIWGEAVHHRWRVEQACTILTLRWTPVEGEG